MGTTYLNFFAWQNDYVKFKATKVRVGPLSNTKNVNKYRFEEL